MTNKILITLYSLCVWWGSSIPWHTKNHLVAMEATLKHILLNVLDLKH